MEKRDQKGGGGGSNSQPNHISSVADKECIVREQDRLMPTANVIRLMRSIIPAHAKISEDAKEATKECVSEFISFVTSEANMRCQQEHRKTITAEDVLWAMNNLGFDDYVEPLTIYLNRMREVESGEQCPLRGDPLVRRSIEQGPMGIATAFTPAPMGIATAFTPAYYIGTNSEHQGFMTMEGFLKDAQNAGSASGTGV